MPTGKRYNDISMNRQELIDSLIPFFPSSKDARMAVIKVFEIMEDALKANRKVVISNFGTFIPKEILPRKMKNPRTKESVITQSRLSIRFRPAKNLVRPRQ